MAMKGEIGTGVGGRVDNTMIVRRLEPKDLPKNTKMVSVKAFESGSGESYRFTRVKHDSLDNLHVHCVTPLSGQGFLTEEWT